MYRTNILHLKDCSLVCTAWKTEAGVVDQMHSRKNWKVLPAGRPRRSIFFFFPRHVLLHIQLNFYRGQLFPEHMQAKPYTKDTFSFKFHWKLRYWIDMEMVKIDSIMLSQMIYWDRRTFETTATFSETFPCNIIRKLSDARGDMTIWSHLLTFFYPITCGFVVFNNIPVIFPSKCYLCREGL